MVYALRAKKNTCEEKLVSKVACCLIPALKQKQKINTDKEKRTKEKITKKNKCQACIKSASFAIRLISHYINGCSAETE